MPLPLCRGLLYAARMAKKIAVILAGCGVYDGSEIQESVLTLHALEQQGATVQCFAPDIDQMHVIDHITGEVSDESRNVLVESARITRGEVLALAKYSANDFDALVLPGGFGAAKNLSSFAVDGAAAKVVPAVSEAVVTTHAAKKPIGALCIAPVILAKLIPGVRITLGADGEAAGGATEMGAVHEVTTHGQIVVDKGKRVVTSPCYMLDASISQVAEGATAMVKELLSMVGSAL